MASLSSSGAASSSRHPYVPSTAKDSRSPCPALNALANHGYLPHDGRSITVPQMVSAMQRVYNMSLPLALLLAIFGVLTCGHHWHINLHDLAKHNVLEHDASLVHADAGPNEIFAPTDVDRPMLQQILHMTSQPFLTLRDLVKVRVLRGAALWIPLDRLHAEISRGEVALTFDELGITRSSNVRGPTDSDYDVSMPVMPKEYVDEWFGQERLPDGWSRPKVPVGLFSVFMLSRRISRMMVALQATLFHAPTHQD